MMKYWEWPEWLMAGLLALIAALLPVMIYASIQEQKEWDAFAKSHDCKVVARKEGSTSTGIAPIVGGQGGMAITTSSSPGQTAFLCSDGVTYWRNN